MIVYDSYQRVTFVSLSLLLKIQVPFWYHFPTVWRTSSNNSFRAGQLAMNSHSCSSSERVFHLEGCYRGYGIPIVLSSYTWKILLFSFWPLGLLRRNLQLFKLLFLTSSASVFWNRFEDFSLSLLVSSLVMICLGVDLFVFILLELLTFWSQ